MKYMPDHMHRSSWICTQITSVIVRHACKTNTFICILLKTCLDFKYIVGCAVKPNTLMIILFHKNIHTKMQSVVQYKQIEITIIF